MYKIVLENNKTKEVITYNDVADLNNGEKLFYKFPINATALEDGEYTLSLYEVGDSEESLIVTDTLCVGNFNVSGLQYKNGEDIYIETKLDTKLEERNVRLEEVKTTIIPNEGYDGMSVVVINAQPVYDAGYNQGNTEGYNNGYQRGNEDGYIRGYEDTKGLMSSITIENNGTYTNENGYNEVNVNVQATIDFSVIGYNEQLNYKANNILLAPLSHSEVLYENWNNSEDKTSTSYLYSFDNEMVFAPNINTRQVTNMNGMFYGTNDLNLVPLYDTRFVEDMSCMFYGCSRLKECPHFDTSNVTNFAEMFYSCVSLEECPDFDTSSATDMNNMFRDCYNLRRIIFGRNTSKVTNMNAMFANCNNLEVAPDLDTSSCSNLDALLYYCYLITEIPHYNTSNCTDMTRMLSYTNIKTIPQLDMSKVTTVEGIFDGCNSLESLPLLDWGNVANTTNVFGWETKYNLTELGGFAGLKVDWAEYDGLYQCPMLTYESIINVINNLYDFRAAGINSVVRTLRLNLESMSKLSDADKAVAAAKGWILVSD